MKIKKTSLFSLIAAAALVVGVTAGFATSAKAEDDSSHAIFDITPGAVDTAVQEVTVISYVNPQDGKTYYSFDGGETFEAMTDEEYAARFLSLDVEWWTYEEYKAWLENEKIELQDMIGERAWTSGRGEFVWTQEIVDETIAMYEGILEDIKNGMLYSKTINGDPDSSLTLAMDPANVAEIYEGPASEADFSEYEPYGLEWVRNEKALYWNGERVRYFLDGVDLDGKGGMAIRLEYADAKLKGNIDVRAVRERVDNGDGSFDPFGPLVGLEKYSQAEFDARTFGSPALDVVDSAKAQSVETTFYAFPELAEEAEEIEELLKPYVPFGLSYIYSTNGKLSMHWQKKPVHSVYDPEKCIWIANNMYGLDLGPDAVDLEAVYEKGKLTGLRESEFHAVTETGFLVEESTAEGNTAVEKGTSFAERFEAYAPFGITYKEAKGASGAGNVYLNGKLVSQFIDENPNGGVFSFTSRGKGGITVKTVYDNSGKLTGVGTIEPAQEQKP